jgi:hypothetical protein
VKHFYPQRFAQWLSNMLHSALSLSAQTPLPTLAWGHHALLTADYLLNSPFFELPRNKPLLHTHMYHMPLLLRS